MILSLVQIFFAVFGVMDPVGNIPFFLMFARTLGDKEKEKFARSAIIYAGCILVVFMFLGNAMLNVFEISIGSFRIAGGLVLVVLGFAVLFNIELGKKKEVTEKEPSIIPLATPLIAGPGMISLVIILAKEYGYFLTFTGDLGDLLLSYVIFRLAPYILKVFGKKELAVFANMMGLILMAIGIEFIRSAL